MVVSRLVFQHLGWGVAASVTPAVMGLAGAVFFGATLLGGGVLGPVLPEASMAAMVGIGATAGIVTQVGAAGSGAPRSTCSLAALWPPPAAPPPPFGPPPPASANPPAPPRPL
jgi:hypothetical protein